MGQRKPLRAPILLAALMVPAACASGNKYACDSHTSVRLLSDGYSYPFTQYSLCDCPNEAPCPWLDIRNQPPPMKIIMITPPKKDGVEENHPETN